MRITDIQPYVVSQELDRPFGFSQWDYSSRSTCLVKVYADDGTYGWGEGYGPAEVVAAGILWLKQFLINNDPRNIGYNWEIMYRRSLDYARSGVLVAAISAIDIALHDLIGKHLGLSVSSMLGGRRSDSVRVYATGLYFTEDRLNEPPLADRLAEEALQYVSLGFNAIKMKVGLSLDSDHKNVATVRAAIGDNVELMVDANHAYSLREARQLIERLEPYDVSWFEEPISPEDIDGYARLCAESSIPIAGGECEYLAHGFARLFRCRAVDIAQPDLCAAGGLTECARIAALARVSHIPMTTHCWGTGVAFAAALHFMATLDPIPGRKMASMVPLEMDQTENPLRDRLVIPKFDAVAGKVSVPNESGLGIDVDEKLLKKWSKAA